jgi:hypothetical protein
MTTLVRRNISLFFAQVALVAVVCLAGCDWLSSSENVVRKSPFISDLKISSTSVFCNAKFTISFNYDDLQGDVARATIARRLQGGGTTTEATEAWPDDINQNLGRVSFPQSFSCDSSGGQYEITVWAEDDGGHKSNVLAGVIFLNKAG